MHKSNYKVFVKRVEAIVMATALTFTMIPMSNGKAAVHDSSQFNVASALTDVMRGIGDADSYTDALNVLNTSLASLEGATTVEGLKVTQVTEDSITISWDATESDSLVGYNVYWADKDTETENYAKLLADGTKAADGDNDSVTVDSDTTTFTYQRATNKNYYFKVSPVLASGEGAKSQVVESPTAKEFHVYLENLDRGLVEIATTNGVFLSWRLLGSEVTGYGATGLTGPDFHVYQDGALIATVTDSTNYLVQDGTDGSTYTVVPVVDGTEVADALQNDAIKMDGVTGAGYLDIPLQIPHDTTVEETYGVSTAEVTLMTQPRTDTYTTTGITYSANDVSVGDVDGDGQYEYFVKWDPSLAKDVSQQGFTGKQYIDCYELDGTLKYRIDLGINIRSGAHYTQFLVYDFNEDGKAEIAMKTAPGTKVITFNNNDQDDIATENYITNPDGVANDEDYVYTATEYRKHLIETFMDWGIWANDSEDMVEAKAKWDHNLIKLFAPESQQATVTEKNEDGTYTSTTMSYEEAGFSEDDLLVNVPVRDENGNVVYTANGGSNAFMETVKFDDPKTGLTASMNHDGGYTEEEATALADYFLNGYQYRMKKHNMNNYEGYIISGSEYLSVFDGNTGAEMDTIMYPFPREDDGMLWGDYAMNYIEPGNRNDRFLATVAYLDGENPSMVFCRGYYTRSTIATYTLSAEGKFELNWTLDSGWTEMTNPFNDGPHGFNGNNTDTGTNGVMKGLLSGQGDHYVEAADVDNDGCQEIIFGGAIVDHNGDLYSSGGDYIETNGNWSKYGHGDSIHTADIDPDRPGLEIFSCFEGGAYAPYGTALRDAETNTAIKGYASVYTGADTGRCMVGDLLPDVRGIELWGVNTTDCKGNKVNVNTIGSNQSIRFAADMTTQIFNNNIVKANGTSTQTMVTTSNISANNGTKGNAGLIADVFGDWREELVVRTADNTALRIYSTTDVTSHKMYTLMADIQYRANVAGQQTAYNQPAYLSFYFAADTDWKYVSIPNATKEQAAGAVVENEKTSTDMRESEDTSKSSEVSLDAPECSALLETELPEYDATVWDTLTTDIAVLQAKLSLMGVDVFTPQEYDSSLVNKLQTIAADLAIVQGKPLVDYSVAVPTIQAAYDAIAQSASYTEPTITAVADAMTNLETVLAAIKAFDVTLQSTKDTFTYWLNGISASDAYSLYVDFDYPTKDAYLTKGYTSVTINTLYSAEVGYGLQAVANGRNRTPDDTLLGDFILGGTFMADVPAGNYTLRVYCGDLLDTANNTSVITVSDLNTSENLTEEVTVKAGKGAVESADITFNVATDTTIGITSTSRLNALLLDQSVPVSVDGVDLSSLQALVDEILEAGIDETLYTSSSYQAFETALSEAQSLLAQGTAYAQQYQLIHNVLNTAYSNLARKEATREFIFDFGTQTSAVATNSMLAGNGYTVSQVTSQGLGTMVYDSTVNDNGQHYGFDRVMSANETVNGGAYFRDYVYSEGGALYTFTADLPIGAYYVYMYSGDKASANTTKLYFGDGEAATVANNTNVEVTEDGKTVYTQVSNGGGQFAAPGCIYTVTVTACEDLKEINGVKMGKFKVTLYDDTTTSATAMCARLNGIEIIPAVEEYVITDFKEATCTENGYEVYTAPSGDFYKKVIKATGHDAGEWVTVTEAGKTSEGLEELRCTKCGEVLESRTIKSLADQIVVEESANVYIGKSYTPAITLPEGLTQDDLKICYCSNHILTASVLFDEVVGIIPGDAVITTTIKCGRVTKTYKTNVTVKLQSITITDSKSKLAVNESATFTAALEGVTGDVEWLSLNPFVAKVDKETGVVTGLRKGKACIVAYNGLISDTVEVTVE